MYILNPASVSPFHLKHASLAAAYLTFPFLTAFLTWTSQSWTPLFPSVFPTSMNKQPQTSHFLKSQVRLLSSSHTLLPVNQQMLLATLSKHIWNLNPGCLTRLPQVPNLPLYTLPTWYRLKLTSFPSVHKHHRLAKPADPPGRFLTLEMMFNLIFPMESFCLRSS